MRYIVRQILSRLAVVALPFFATAVVLPGCIGWTRNPARLGNLPMGDIIRTHAKPGGWGYYRDFDRAAKTITVTPVESVGNVGTQHVFIATVCDADGDSRRNRRVEWHVTGAGHIVEVDESGVHHGRGYLVDDKYAVSYTNYLRHTITRGNDDPSDDIHLKPGQSWVVITSPEEGTTHVTAYAPGIYNWDRHKVFATRHWVNVVPCFPRSAVNPAGQPHTLTTQLVRGTDRRPATGYRVRYRVVSGPPAVLDPGGAQAVEVVSDTLGNATAVLRQVQPVPGDNVVDIEVVRPPDTPTGNALVLARHQMTKTWVAAQLSIQKTGPSTAAVGQPIPYHITVLNSGSGGAAGIQVRDTLAGLSLVSSNPPATPQGETLYWTFPQLGPQQSATIEMVCTPMGPGTIRNCAQILAGGAVVSESCAVTNVMAGTLTISKSGPQAAVVGQRVPFQITVANTGGAPVTNIQVTDTFDPNGFSSDQTGTRPAGVSIPGLAPGESKMLDITLNALRPGQYSNVVTAVAPGGLQAQAVHNIIVDQPSLRISKTGPATAFAGGAPVNFIITVQNAGRTPATNVIVRDPMPPQLRPQLASAGGVIQGNTVTWNLGTLAPGQQAQLSVQAIAIANGENVCNSAEVVADGLRQEAPQTCMNIRGVPALLTEIIDRAGVVALGSETTFAIRITNQGSAEVNDAVLVCTYDSGFQFVDAESDPSVSFRHDARARTVTFTPALIPVGKGLIYQVQLRATAVGDQRVRMSVQSRILREPLFKDESTTVYDPATGKFNFKAPKPGTEVILPAGGEPKADDQEAAKPEKTNAASGQKTADRGAGPNEFPVLKPINLLGIDENSPSSPTESLVPVKVESPE